MDHDALLAKHRARFAEHRQWMEEHSEADAASPVPAAPQAPVHQAPAYEALGYEVPAPEPSATPSYAIPAAVTPLGLHTAAMREGSPRAGSARGSVRDAPSPLAVHSRATQWAKRREQKMEERRESTRGDVDAECSFHPQTHGSAARSDRPIPVAGLSSFLKRRHAAQDLKEERAAASSRCDGSRWNNEITVPREFQLGRRRGPVVKALQQPLKAPRAHAPQEARSVLQGIATERDDAVKVPKGVFSAYTSSEIIDAAVLSTAHP